MTILANLDTIRLEPSVSGGDLLLKVSSTGGAPATINVEDNEDVQDNVYSTTITSVRIKVIDSGDYKMYVVPTDPSGSEWPRGGGDTYSVKTEDVPSAVNNNNELTVRIEARKTGSPTVTRSQKLIIRRISPPF